MKVKTHVKAGQVGLIGVGVAVIGQASGTGNPENNGQIGVLNIGAFGT
jgi:hypothetical protein